VPKILKGASRIRQVIAGQQKELKETLAESRLWYTFVAATKRKQTESEPGQQHFNQLTANS